MAHGSESEAFNNELLRLNEEGATQEINDELISMGSPEEVDAQNEQEDQRAFEKEMRWRDIEANAPGPAYERQRRYQAMLTSLEDLLRNGGLERYMTIGFIVDSFRGKDDITELTKSLSSESKFYEKAAEFASFISSLETMAKEGLAIWRKMSVQEAIDALNQKISEAQDVIDQSHHLEALEKLRMGRDQFLRMCNVMNILRQSGEAWVRASTHGNQFRALIQCRDEKQARDLAASIGAPGSRPKTNGREIEIDAEFDERFLEEAKEEFPWIR